MFNCWAATQTDGVRLMIYWWGACNKAAPLLSHSPPRWQCRPLEIWAGTGPLVWSRTGSGDESDTALLCCTPLVHRPLRRFKDGGDENDAAAGKMLLRLRAGRCGLILRPKKEINNDGCVRVGVTTDGLIVTSRGKVAVDVWGISVSQWSGPAKLDVKPQYQPYIIKPIGADVERFAPLWFPLLGAACIAGFRWSL